MALVTHASFHFVFFFFLARLFLLLLLLFFCFASERGWGVREIACFCKREGSLFSFLFFFFLGGGERRCIQNFRTATRSKRSSCCTSFTTALSHCSQARSHKFKSLTPRAWQLRSEDVFYVLCKECLWSFPGLTNPKSKITTTAWEVKIYSISSIENVHKPTPSSGMQHVTYTNDKNITLDYFFSQTRAEIIQHHGLLLSKTTLFLRLSFRRV